MTSYMRKDSKQFLKTFFRKWSPYRDQLSECLETDIITLNKHLPNLQYNLESTQYIKLVDELLIFVSRKFVNSKSLRKFCWMKLLKDLITKEDELDNILLNNKRERSFFSELMNNLRKGLHDIFNSHLNDDIRKISWKLYHQYMLWEKNEILFKHSICPELEVIALHLSCIEASLQIDKASLLLSEEYQSTSKIYFESLNNLIDVIRMSLEAMMTNISEEDQLIEWIALVMPKICDTLINVLDFWISWFLVCKNDDMQFNFYPSSPWGLYSNTISLLYLWTSQALVEKDESIKKLISKMIEMTPYFIIWMKFEHSDAFITTEQMIGIFVHIIGYERDVALNWTGTFIKANGIDVIRHTIGYMKNDPKDVDEIFNCGSFDDVYLQIVTILQAILEIYEIEKNQTDAENIWILLNQIPNKYKEMVVSRQFQFACKNQT